MSRHIDLSHVISDGLQTYPGLPAPSIGVHLTRSAAEELYGPDITFTIGMIEICTNTGTYLDVPFYRFADGHDLIELSLDRVAQVQAVCLDKRGLATIELKKAEVAHLGGHAVLIRTDHSQFFGTEAYPVNHPHLKSKRPAPSRFGPTQRKILSD